MSYQNECIATFDEYIREQDWDEITKEVARQTFRSAFEYGSLSSSADSVKEQAIERMKPIKNKKAREIIEKLSLIRK